MGRCWPWHDPNEDLMASSAAAPRLKSSPAIFYLQTCILVLNLACGSRVPDPPKVEARAVWLHRFEYTSGATTYGQDTIRATISNVIANAAAANFNVIIFQVRGNGDAYYRSGLEPWGKLLTGTLGGDPGWDPLDFALEEAHRRGLELHAWINTFPAWRGLQPPPITDPPLAYLAHPEWVVADSAGIPMPLSAGYVSFSPGVPAVHDHIIAVVQDILQRYAVDGIHFDYIRYPGEAPSLGYSRDAISVARFGSKAGNPYRLDWDDWQREQLTEFMAKAYNAIVAIRPSVKVSAAVNGSYNDASWNAYHVVYQDPRRWTELGKLDFVMPMIYWPRNHPTQPFMVRTAEWHERYTLDRVVIPGIASYRYNSNERDMTWREAEGQIDAIRRYGNGGMSFFDARSLSQHWDDLAQGRFRSPAFIPAATWKDSTRPGPPDEVAIDRFGDSVHLTWVPPDDSDVTRYAIYASRRSIVDASVHADLLAITADARLQWAGRLNRKRGYIAITALDAAWNEGPLSPPIRIPKP